MSPNNKKNNISAIIQARVGSTRLPGKVLMPICGKSVLQHIIERLDSSKLVNQIILAIPDSEENNILENFAKENFVKYYRGSEDEVLERVYLAAKENNCDVIVEVTGDNPLIDPEIIDLAVGEHLDNKADFSCINYGSKFLPIGLDVGVLSFQALEEAYENAKDPYNREHVTSYFHENPNIFKNIGVSLPEHLLGGSNLRLTLDTKEDFELINNIYAKLYKPGEIFKTEEILNLFKSQPELKATNARIIQKTR